MDLINKITDKLKNETDLHSPIIELHYDDQKNVIGHIADEKFKGLSDENSQKLIWETLKKNLEDEELFKVISIFHETPQERVSRINGFKTTNTTFSNFWFHQTPELAKYWLFIDVAKFGEDFKSFFMIICEKNSVNRGLTFLYNKEVLEFMELESGEAYSELYQNTFNNAEVEIKMDLMNFYEKYTNQSLFGKANMYWYHPP